MRCWELKSYKGLFVLETVKSKEVVPNYGTLNKHDLLEYCFGVYNLHYLAASFLVFIANWSRGMSDGIVFTWLHSVWILKDQGWKKQRERFFTSSITRKTVKELWFQSFFLWRVSSSDQASFLFLGPLNPFINHIWAWHIQLKGVRASLFSSCWAIINNWWN